MSLGAAIDVGIGLIFVYLLLSLIATASQEVLARLLDKRGEELFKGLRDLVDGNAATSQLFTNLWTHPLVQNGSVGRKPSYVAATNFSAALLHVLMGAPGTPSFADLEAKVKTLPAGSPLQKSLEALLAAADGKIELFRTKVEHWFDGAMDRVSGTYKRWGQTCALVIGLAVAVTLNVDSIQLARALWTNEPLRTAVVAGAVKYVNDHPNTPDAAAPKPGQPPEAQKVLDGLKLPIGWNGDGPILSQILNAIFLSGWSALLVLLGWIITALAVSLGSPFWFDLLKSFVNLRAAGPKPPPAAK